MQNTLSEHQINTLVSKEISKMTLTTLVNAMKRYGKKSQTIEELEQTITLLDQQTKQLKQYYGLKED